MAERKVLNKYFPPDFDPAKLPKLKLDKHRQYVVRLMAPFNMRCTTCGEYIYKGKKFNARKETVANETYLGLEIYRFYIRCPRCISEITFKTDPENTDYVAEKGATRNFQAMKKMEEEEDRLKREREDEELNNPMKALENRTKESKQEMDILEKLEELRDLNARHAKIDHDKLLEQNLQYAKEIEERQEREDEELVQSVFGPKKFQKRLSSDSESDEDLGRVMKRKHNDESDLRKATDHLIQETQTTAVEPDKKKTKSWEKSVGKLNKVSLHSLVKRKEPTKNNEVQGPTSTTGESSKPEGSLGLLGNYSSDSSEES